MIACHISDKYIIQSIVCCFAGYSEIAALVIQHLRAEILSEQRLKFVLCTELFKMPVGPERFQLRMRLTKIIKYCRLLYAVLIKE